MFLASEGTVIDAQVFYRELGATEAMDQDQQLMLEGQVRVACSEIAWTAIFEDLPADLTRMAALMDVCRSLRHAVPLRTRSGHLAVRSQHSDGADETFTGLQNLRALMRHMRPMNPGV